jgi:hypothetical protein
MREVGLALSGLEQGGSGAVAEGLLWCRRAALSGDVSSMINAGRILANGYGVARNASATAGWFEKAAVRGSGDGMCELVELKWAGLERSSDTMEALAVGTLRWLRKAVGVGSARGMRLMASAHRMGLGVARDERAALEWERRAVAQEAVMGRPDRGVK